MRILADENITLVREHFSPFGEVHTVAGRSIEPALVRDCDALLVRSVTKVDMRLLAGSRCRFVATATSGIDHIDTVGLAAAGIKLGWAKGCNAISVVDYFFSSLAALSLIDGRDWRKNGVGIVGCGQIGGALAARLLTLGLTVRIYDPFLTDAHPLARHFCSLDEVLQQQIITLHVPLTRDGPWPTRHMLTEALLTSIPGGSILLNAARGEVVDNELLLRWLSNRAGQQLVLDAWEHEPAVSAELLKQVSLGTPHIAGYSQEGKLQGTRMIQRDFCQHFDLAVPGAAVSSDRVALTPAQTDDPLLQLNQLLLSAYDVRKDHAAMLELLRSATPAADFDKLRKHYPVRHEFSRFVMPSGQLLPSVRKAAVVLGFGLLD